MLPVPEQFPKLCTCCKRLHSKEEWAQLLVCGVFVDDWEAMELRHCQCKSTLSVITAIFQKYSEAA